MFQHHTITTWGRTWCETNLLIRSMQKRRFIYTLQIPSYL